MNVTSVSNASYTAQYDRLRKDDITRLPALNINRIDYYQGAKATQSIVKKKSLMPKIFTAATFGLTGIFIAHRNNLFNPVKREVRKILRNSELKTKVLNYLKDKINPETYKLATTKFLNDIINNKDNGENFILQTKKIIESGEELSKLNSAVIKRLEDDSNLERLKNGFAADIIDRLGVKIEKNLAKAKNQGLAYKNQGNNIIEATFAEAEDGSSPIKDTLFESINNRSKNTIENFIRDAQIKSQLDNVSK